MTGMHVVADISCKACGAELGWKYVSVCFACLRLFVVAGSRQGTLVSITITMRQAGRQTGRQTGAAVCKLFFLSVSLSAG